MSDIKDEEGYKIDVKCACYIHNRNGWTFKIGKNQIADYFLFLAFNNRDDLNPMGLGLIKGMGVVHGKRLNEFSGISICQSKIDDYKKYEISDKLEQVKSCCNIRKCE